MVKPGTMGGANWPPSSYDPGDEPALRVRDATASARSGCARSSRRRARTRSTWAARFGQADVDDGGIFAALDVRTNRLAWRQQWREICYSGSIVTAGGLLFVGRADGRLTALDKRNGAKLWEFMTDAGVNTTVTTFEHKGKQYVVVHAGGGVFANGKRGDGIWMFSLDGKIESLAPPKPAGPGGPGGGRRAGPARRGRWCRGPGSCQAPALRPRAGHSVPRGVGSPLNRANGEKIYKSACLPCHGESGEGGHGGGPSLIVGQTSDKIISISTTGKNNMPSFAATLSSR